MEFLDELLANKLVSAISVVYFFSGMLLSVVIDGLFSIAIAYFKDKKFKNSKDDKQ